ncbi:MAG: hypothetical protein H6728_06035 [Myxococcales bacterium]|nr:hypothetical protein [Myxococcales bacterium]
MRKQWYVWMVLSLWLWGVQTAQADVVPPEVGVCEQKAVGDACEWSGVKGTCQSAKCTKLDYSDGSPPQSVEYDCVKCTSGGAPSESPAAESPAAESPAKESTPADGSAQENTPPKTGGCNQFQWPGSGGSSALLACFFLLGLWLTRRSRHTTDTPS